MTQYIYMASPMKLPEGSFDLKPVSPEQSNVFKDELDFTHLHFEDITIGHQKQDFHIVPTLKNEHSKARLNPIQESFTMTFQYSNLHK
ncbi:hypothetical protein AKG34_18745 [Peribacillus butanolivorans]|uniref:hypothetical protein n=1 Tax=Peribacillus butanolivorans TaxID=421767 RepID=UPI0006A741DB|nr:hypothetical protein [Peribacillus butanolivorans]KON70604.1 hypothetical protein AKG34_18745 [Peribacillus butanolivorans]